MPQLIGPGVSVTEVNLTQNAPSFSTSSAALVGESNKGSLDVRLITSTQQFLQEYGNPVPGKYFHYSALAYLRYGTQLYCQRVVNGALYGGVKVLSNGNPTAFSVGSASQSYVGVSGESSVFYVYAKDPGTWNNSISISIANVNVSTYTFDIKVYYTDPVTNVTTQVETWAVSRKTKLDGYGDQLYLETKINGYSSYINVQDSLITADTVLPQANSTAVFMAYGSNGSAATDSNIALAWSTTFGTPENIDVRILINGGYTGTLTQAAINTLTTTRKDCMAILDFPAADVQTTTTMTAARSNNNIDNPRACIYGPWILDGDNFNGSLVQLPNSGYVAGAWAYNDSIGEVWDAPAGFTRGQLSVVGVTGMSALYPNSVLSSGDRDVLHVAQVNAIQNWRGGGIVLFDQLTLTQTSSDLSYINVVRSLINIEKTLKFTLNQFLQARNNDATRLGVKATLDEYFSRLAAAGAFDTSYDKGYSVVCDLTNNNAGQIQNGELHVDIYIHPVLAVSKIYAQVILVPTGVNVNLFTSQGQLI